MSIESKDFLFGSISPTLQKSIWDLIEQAINSESAFIPPQTKNSLSLDQDNGTSMTQILSEVQKNMIPFAINVRHPWAMAHMVPPPATISVLADLLIGALNQCAFIWEEAPLAFALEAETIKWMADRIGFGPQAGGLLTSGGTTSNCLATFLALQRMRSQRVMGGLPSIIVSDQAHFSIQKSAAISGLDKQSVIPVPTDSAGRLKPGAIQKTASSAVSNGRTPFLFICTAGTTNAGTCEPIDEFLSTARMHNAWCHVDAAYGGMACLSSTRHMYTEKWAEADSVSWDPHKSLYVSYAVGALLLRARSMLDPLEFRSEYAFKSDQADHAGLWHLEGSRRMEALKLWMTIKNIGRNGYRELIDHSIQMANEIASRISDCPELQLVCEPDLNIVCFRFYDPYLSEPTLDDVNSQLQKTLFFTGGPLISSTSLGGKIVLRVVTLNPLLQIHHLSAALKRIQHIAREIATSLTPKERENEGVATDQSTP